MEVCPDMWAVWCEHISAISYDGAHRQSISARGPYDLYIPLNLDRLRTRVSVLCDFMNFEVCLCAGKRVVWSTSCKAQWYDPMI